MFRAVLCCTLWPLVDSCLDKGRHACWEDEGSVQMGAWIVLEGGNRHLVASYLSVHGLGDGGGVVFIYSLGGSRVHCVLGP